MTSQKSQIPNTPNMFQGIGLKQTSADAGIDTPTFGDLWNDTYPLSDAHLWSDPTLDSWRNMDTRPLSNVNL